MYIICVELPPVDENPKPPVWELAYNGLKYIIKRVQKVAMYSKCK